MKQIRIDDVTKRRLKVYAVHRNVTIAVAVKELVAAALRAEKTEKVAAYPREGNA